MSRSCRAIRAKIHDTDLSNCILILSVFFLPPYATFLLILVFIFVFDAFIRSIAWAFILDIFYGGGGFLGIHPQYLSPSVRSFFSSVRSE